MGSVLVLISFPQHQGFQHRAFCCIDGCANFYRWWGGVAVHCMDTPQFVYPSPVDGRLGCFILGPR